MDRRQSNDSRPGSSRILLLVLVLGLFAGACGASDENGSAGTGNEPEATIVPVEPSATSGSSSTPTETPQPAATPAPGEARIDAPKLWEAESGLFVDGQNSFATDYYRAAVEENDSNLIFSPYSIALAFSMVYAGARGETEAQMADVLGFLPQETHHPAANAVD